MGSCTGDGAAGRSFTLLPLVSWNSHMRHTHRRIPRFHDSRLKINHLLFSDLFLL